MQNEIIEPRGIVVGAPVHVIPVEDIINPGLGFRVGGEPISNYPGRSETVYTNTCTHGHMRKENIYTDFHK